MRASARRPRYGVVMLVALTTATALIGAVTATARADGVTRERLEAAGWTCFASPAVPDTVGCFDPGRGRPFPGNPDRRPSYSLLAFSASTGEFLYAVHLIRADLYAGQPCGDHPYIFRGLIGYYECVHA
jgi:hypothetical protein